MIDLDDEELDDDLELDLELDLDTEEQAEKIKEIFFRFRRYRNFR